MCVTLSPCNMGKVDAASVKMNEFKHILRDLNFKIIIRLILIQRNVFLSITVLCNTVVI